MQFLLGAFKWINHSHYFVAQYHYQLVHKNFICIYFK